MRVGLDPFPGRAQPSLDSLREIVRMRLGRAPRHFLVVQSLPLRRHVPSNFLRSPLTLAGEEGFEPPHPVLETGGLPLNLLPFTLSRRPPPAGWFGAAGLGPNALPLSQLKLLPAAPTLQFLFFSSRRRTTLKLPAP